MKNALVLAGGGVAGIAWELGVLRGLQDTDPELAARVLAADLVVGTSAGSAVAAQITSGVPLADLAAGSDRILIINPADPDQPAPFGALDEEIERLKPGRAYVIPPMPRPWRRSGPTRSRRRPGGPRPGPVVRWGGRTRPASPPAGTDGRDRALTAARPRGGLAELAVNVVPAC